MRIRNQDHLLRHSAEQSAAHEAGLMTPGMALSLGKLTLLGLGVGVVGLRFLGGYGEGEDLADKIGKMKPQYNVSQEETKIEAKVLGIEPMQLECKASHLIDVTDSLIRYDLKVLDKTIPEMYQTATMGPDSKIALETCFEGIDAIEAVDIASGDSIADEKIGYAPTEITIAVDKLKTSAQFAPGHDLTVMDQGSVLKIWSGGASQLAGGSELACKVAMAGAGLVGIDSGDLCGNAKNIDASTRELEAKAATDARARILETVRQKVAERSWLDTTILIRDAYKDQAVKLTGNQDAADLVTVSFVDANGKKVIIPEEGFSPDVLDVWREKGMLIDTKDIAISDVDNLKIEIPAPREPKYPTAPPVQDNKPKVQQGGTA